ncbi:hypothetical protein MPH_08413 [Macrophomina phaseolina MS6]|uniref:Uncharacterized protein n=1 Tax=Macrophomina phaseolina (strain MS6) TaxID=1126212 RepID=K2RW63_MACPH|nr:hypothetical protein MPH_08413 [Macrophomina phaseolina MS6]
MNLKADCGDSCNPSTDPMEEVNQQSPGISPPPPGRVSVQAGFEKAENITSRHDSTPSETSGTGGWRSWLQKDVIAFFFLGLAVRSSPSFPPRSSGMIRLTRYTGSLTAYDCDDWSQRNVSRSDRCFWAVSDLCRRGNLFYSPYVPAPDTPRRANHRSPRRQCTLPGDFHLGVWYSRTSIRVSGGRLRLRIWTQRAACVRGLLRP